MAALIHTVPFQGGVKSCSRNSGAQRRALVCRAEAREEGAWVRTASISLLAAGLAATVMVNTPAPANAGVEFVQPQLKRQRAFQKSDKPQEPAPQQESSSGGGFSLPSLPSLPAPSLPGLPTPSLPTPSGISFPSLPEFDTTGGIDPRSVALPGALAGIAAAGYAAYSFDGGFRSMIREGLVKDSTGYAGYEEEIKGDPNSTQYIGSSVKGTKKVGVNPKRAVGNKSKKGAKGKTAKKGGFSLFG